MFNGKAFYDIIIKTKRLTRFYDIF